MTYSKKEKLDELLKDSKTFMLVTCDREGVMTARPMAAASVENDAALYFFTSIDTKKTDEIIYDQNVLLTFQDSSRFISLSGHASISRHAEKIEELWKEPYKVWFPEGTADPQLALISFKADTAEYWSNEGMNKVRYIFEAVKAYAIGEKPEVQEPQQHGRLTL